MSKKAPPVVPTPGPQAPPKSNLQLLEKLVELSEASLRLQMHQLRIQTKIGQLDPTDILLDIQRVQDLIDPTTEIEE